MFTAHTPTLSADEMVERLVELGLRYARVYLETGYVTRGGIPKAKTVTHRREDLLQLATIADALDRVQWYGAWGINAHAIRLELLRRAQEAP